MVIIPGVYENWQFMLPLIQCHPRRRASRPRGDGAAAEQAGRPAAARLVAQHLEEAGLHDAAIVAHSKGGLIGKVRHADAGPGAADRPDDHRVHAVFRVALRPVHAAAQPADLLAAERPDPADGPRGDHQQPDHAPSTGRSIRTFRRAASCPGPPTSSCPPPGTSGSWGTPRRRGSLWSSLRGRGLEDVSDRRVRAELVPTCPSVGAPRLLGPARPRPHRRLPVLEPAVEHVRPGGARRKSIGPAFGWPSSPSPASEPPMGHRPGRAFRGATASGGPSCWVKYRVGVQGKVTSDELRVEAQFACRAWAAVRRSAGVLPLTSGSRLQRASALWL